MATLSTSVQRQGVLFIVDPLDGLKPAKDSSIAMMFELGRRGHAIWACTPRELAWSAAAGATARAQLLALERDPHAAASVATAAAPWHAAAAGVDHLRLADFTAVLMRKDPPFDAEYLATTHLLEAAVREGARVFNAPAALRHHNEKIAIAEFADFLAPTLVSCDARAILDFHREQGAIVVKPLDGMGGAGVFRIQPGDPNTNVILETATHDGARTVMAQRFLPAIAEGDKRILLIDGTPVPFALARVPKPGEARGNLAAGGTGRTQPLSPRDRLIAETLGPVLAARGLLLVGLDVIGDCLTEINVTSPTCFVEIRQQSGFDVAGAFVDALERRIAG